MIFAITIFVPKTFFGSSEIYTMDERKAAANLIKEKINAKEGCMLFLIKYEGDSVLKSATHSGRFFKCKMQNAECKIAPDPSGKGKRFPALVTGLIVDLKGRVGVCRTREGCLFHLCI